MAEKSSFSNKKLQGLEVYTNAAFSALSRLTDVCSRGASAACCMRCFHSVEAEISGCFRELCCYSSFGAPVHPDASRRDLYPQNSLFAFAFFKALISWRNASALSSQIFHNNIKRLISISALCTRNSSATFDNYVGGLVSRLVTVINGSQWSDFHVMFDKWPGTSGFCRSLIVGRLRTVGQSR